MSRLPSSLPRICVALGLDRPDALARAAEAEIRDGNTFLEFRLDYLQSPEKGIAVLERLLKQQPELYVLATCRHKNNHGGFNGSQQAQFQVLADAARAGAQMVDLEVESAAPMKKSLPLLREHAALIVSYHNFESTPALAPVWRRIRALDADAYKIVVTSRKPGDNLRTAEFLREKHDCPLIAFAMSETGAPTRVLSLAAGCMFTYAAPLEGSGTAPGQIPAKTMRALYRADKLSKQSRVFGVVADPVAHSKSPQIHNRAFQSKRIDAVYLPFRVAPAAIGDWMKFAGGLPVAGFSVTIPHKQRIMRYLDVIDPLARRIGAVNTVWRKGGKWRGANTDVTGILKPLEKRLRLRGASVLVAGYGGAARAAAIALHDAGAHLTITGRNVSGAEGLAKVVGAEAVSLDRSCERQFDVLLNATPVGMQPHTNACLFENRLPGHIVFDMVYNPSETVLLKRARSQGCTVVEGLEMFLEQAAEQFEIWTGESAPRSVMRQAIES